MEMELYGCMRMHAYCDINIVPIATVLHIRCLHHTRSPPQRAKPHTIRSPVYYSVIPDKVHSFAELAACSAVSGNGRP